MNEVERLISEWNEYMKSNGPSIGEFITSHTDITDPLQCADLLRVIMFNVGIAGASQNEVDACLLAFRFGIFAATQHLTKTQTIQ